MRLVKCGFDKSVQISVFCSLADYLQHFILSSHSLICGYALHLFPYTGNQPFPFPLIITVKLCQFLSDKARLSVFLC